MRRGEKIESFILADTYEGDPDRTQYVASLYNSDQQSLAVEENIEYELFVDVMQQIISMCVTATITSSEQGNRSNARALAKNNQLLMARFRGPSRGCERGWAQRGREQIHGRAVCPLGL